jgi:hypothetical protein
MYRRAMLICAGLVLVGAFLAFIGIPTSLPAAARPAPEPEDADHQQQHEAEAEDPDPAPAHATVAPVRIHCAIAGPPLQPHPVQSRPDTSMGAEVNE